MQSTHNVVVTAVDGRGTHSNGQEYKFLMYKKMGSVEIEDQVAGAK
jgi:dipeptidyl aminopeptidase/acylaminoacyl peptidase